MHEKGGIHIETKPRFFIGLDTHKRSDTACIINYDNEKLVTFTFKNEPQYFTDVLSKILKTTKSNNIIFGLEDTNSFGFTFAKYLTSINFVVKPVSPALGSAYRKSLPNYHKTDDFDSYCVAKILKESYQLLPSFHHEQIFSNIRLLVNQRHQLVKQRSRNFIQLHQQITKVYPGYSEFFCELQVKSALAFFEHFPAPRHLKGYSKEQLAKEMKQYTKIFRESKAEKILHIVRANRLPYDDEVVEDMIVDLIQDIYYKQDKIATLEKRLVPLVEQTGYKLHTIPGVNIATAAKLISEIGSIEKFKNHKQLARFAGVAPVTMGSAGKNIDESSKGGKRQLRAILHFMAIGMITIDKNDKARHPVFRDYFLQRLKDGKSKPQALVCIMRQLVQIIYSMMKNKTEWVMPEHQQKLTLTKDGKVVDR